MYTTAGWSCYIVAGYGFMFRVGDLDVDSRMSFTVGVYVGNCSYWGYQGTIKGGHKIPLVI